MRKPVRDGATTIPESWNGFETCSSSFNHYSYGAVCDFLFKYIAGIRPVEEDPGYKKIMICPLPGGSLTQARAAYDSIHGMIVSGWEKTASGFHYEVEIPANTCAIIRIQGNEADYRQILKNHPKSTFENGMIEIPVGSGIWSFRL